MTDQERLAEALKRAEEWDSFTNQNAYDWLINWAEAVKLLHCWHQEAYEKSDGSSLTPPIMHDGICGATCGDPCEPCKVITKFCNTMLGERDT